MRATDGFNDYDLSRFSVGGAAGAGDTIIFCSPVESLPERMGAAGGRVLNVSAKTMELCRDQLFIRQNFADGMKFPEISRERGMGRSGWIIKLQKSAGGLGIRPDDGEPGEGEYRQEFIEGVSAGAVYFTSAGETALCGVARHINDGFKFAGAVYPADLDESTMAVLGGFGGKIADATGLLGWWGADFIISDAGPYFLEVNPRFTAGMELLAKACGLDLVGAQVRAFSGDLCHIVIKPFGGYFGRMVVYAR
ncbi:ATP-grasp domain-containing protein, partial [Candidatus Sumerlaeota bacterium]|nr:ATP-grasp domain-containing protein [Candidatus Sumerlaeota bacterium]